MQPLRENMSNISGFLGKLWKIVNDPNTDHLICWSPAGNSFIIQNRAHFWYDLLPLYYKHNNMSSFVRQLNMYGFHKMSSVDNGAMDSDKDEIQFFHKYFRRGQPGLLRNIKRKPTNVSRSDNVAQNGLRVGEISQVLSDVQNLYGVQADVDAQLNTMKEENAILWRELSILRRKHQKQQQIVNKLIQFLVTLVQPSASSRMGVGVRRRMPLMLHGNPAKKVKSVKKENSTNSTDNGPTIHELDGEIEISPGPLLQQDARKSEKKTNSSPQASVASPSSSSQPDTSVPVIEAQYDEACGTTLPEDFWNKPEFVVSSPQASIASPSSSSQPDTSVPVIEVQYDDACGTSLPEDFWDKPEFVQIASLNPDDMLCDNDPHDEEEESPLSLSQGNDKVFVNPNSRDMLLSNLANGSYNSTAVSTVNGKKEESGDKTIDNSINSLLNFNNKDSNTDMQVATRVNSSAFGTNDCSRDDLDLHLEATQSEIDKLKDILKGCNGLDANTLLGLFNEELPTYGLSYIQNDNSRDNMLDTSTGLISEI